MTDTPIQPPATRLERVKSFIGDLARPFAIIWTAACAGVSMLILALKIDDPVQAGVFIGVVYTTGVSTLYLGKAWEVAKTGKQSAEVEIAKAKSETG
ncbi:hypothetical protein [Brevundimonas sp.]|uniref:hypothetical protein n=1 Tax=Brevundimonas sp. TaxID=1871086 RepID=UPI0028A0E090|nr:hypothetical protein [Brevundimonas sp.]